MIFTYDPEGQIKTQTDALGNKTQYAYNSYGDLIEIINAKDDKTRFEYNTDGLKTKVIYPDNATIDYKYDVLGRLIETKDKLGRVSKKEYDSFGRVAKVITPNGRFIEYKYDQTGNLINILDEKNNKLSSDYNVLGQATKNYDTLNNLLTEKEYNSLGLPKIVSDGTGKKVEFQYDSLNRLTHSTLSDSISASVVYDTLGQVKEVIDPKGNKTTYEYDTLGNPSKETNSLGRVTTYAYDLSSRVKKLVNPNQVSIDYTYDEVGNIKKLLFSGGNNEDSISFAYDELYNPVSIKGALGEVSYNHDALNRVIKRKDVFGNTLAYSYDSIGRLATITYPDGKSVEYQYNDDDQLVKITDFNGNITRYEYDNLSNLAKVTYPNGFYTSYKYDSNHRLIKLQNYNTQGSIVTANTLTRNNIGDIAKVDRTDYIAPDLANIIPTNFSVNKANQITANGNDTFSYDNNGNLLNYKISGKAINFKYNLRDKVSSATIGSDSFAYQYDAEDNRVVVTKNGATTRYVIDNVLGLQKPLAETNRSNTVQKYYIYGNGLVYAVNKDGLMEIYLYDHQGSTTAIANKSGQILNAYAYSAYGKVLGSSETVDNDYKYLGKYGVITDSNSLLYIRARYYSPELHRFTQTDYIQANIKNPLSLNRYRYTEGNPIGFIDINGYWAGIDDFVAIVGGAVVGVVGQGISDIISTAIQTGTATYASGEFTFKGHLSDWETYTGAAVGGAAAGETLLYTANPILAGAAGGFASSSTKHGLYAFQGETTLSQATRDIVTNTALGGLTGIIKVKPNSSNSLSTIKIKGSFLTFDNETQNTIIKGLINGTTTKIGSSTVRKLATTTIVDGLESSISSVAVGGIYGAIDESVKTLVLVPLIKINNNKYKQ